MRGVYVNPRAFARQTVPPGAGVNMPTELGLHVTPFPKEAGNLYLKITQCLSAHTIFLACGGPWAFDPHSFTQGQRLQVPW